MRGVSNMLVSPSRETYPPDVDNGQIVEPHFSWSRCDCGDSRDCNLGGDRYDIEYYNTPQDSQLKTMTVCSDCYYLIMTGERPDDYNNR